MLDEAAPPMRPLTPFSISEIDAPPALPDRTVTIASRTSPGRRLRLNLDFFPVVMERMVGRLDVFVNLLFIGNVLLSAGGLTAASTDHPQNGRRVTLDLLGRPSTLGLKPDMAAGSVATGLFLGYYRRHDFDRSNSRKGCIGCF